MNRSAEAGPDEGVRVVYTDLDGTLLGPRGSLFSSTDGPSARAAEAVAGLHEAGIALVPVSGRNRVQMREAARVLGAASYIAEMGAYVVDAGSGDAVANFGEFRGRGTPFEAIARSGAGGFLLDRYAGRLEMHTPWALEPREASLVLRGVVEEAEVEAALADAGYGWLTMVDNGVLSRTYPTLPAGEVHLYHLLPRGVGKASAIARQRDLSGLRKEHAVAIGDSPSDLEMASEVGTMFMVSPLDEAGMAGLENVVVTASRDGDGFGEAVEALLARR